MKRFSTLLVLYFAASVVSWHNYDQLVAFLKPLDYTISMLVDSLLGPLGWIGTYGYPSRMEAFFVIWLIESAGVVLLLGLACFRQERRKRVFWWWVLAGFWLLSGVYLVLVQLYG